MASWVLYTGSATLAKVSGGKGLERTIVDTVTLDAMVPEGRCVCTWGQRCRSGRVVGRVCALQGK